MIKVFTTQTCASCATVKRYLDGKKVKYKVVDVTEDPETRQKLFKLTNSMIFPVITKGDKFVVGLNIPGLVGLINE